MDGADFMYDAVGMTGITSSVDAREGSRTVEYS